MPFLPVLTVYLAKTKTVAKLAPLSRGISVPSLLWGLRKPRG